MKNENQVWLPSTLEANQRKLVSEVSSKIEYDINAAMALCVALLEYVNAHKEAAEVNAVLNKME